MREVGGEQRAKKPMTIVLVPRSGFIKLWKTPSCDPVLTIRVGEDRHQSVCIAAEAKLDRS